MKDYKGQWNFENRYDRRRQSSFSKSSLLVRLINKTDSFTRMLKI